MALAATKANRRSEAFFVYRPTSTEKILRTFPISEIKDCAPDGDLNLIKHFSFRRVG